MSRGCPVVDFDHHGEQFAKDQAAYLQELRRACPIAYTEAHGGYYVATGFPEVRSILTDDDSFSVARAEDGSGGLLIPPPRHHTIEMVPGEIDPPEHGQYRKPLFARLSKARMEETRPMIARVVSEKLDAIVAAGDFDVIADFTNAVPAAVIMILLGFPAEELDRFYHATIATFGVGQAAGGDAAGNAELTGWMQARIKELVAEKREQPSDDLLSELAHLPDREFTEVELHGYVMNLLAGGIITTSASAAYGLLALHEDRELRRSLSDDRSALSGAIEEFVRLVTPAVAIARTATKAVAVGDAQLSAGDRVLMVFPSANVDERQYTDPTAINPARKGQHLGFGAGAHYCLGVHLARVELQEMFGQVLDRIPEYVIDVDRAQRIERRAILNGWTSMPAHSGEAVTRERDAEMHPASTSSR